MAAILGDWGSTRLRLWRVADGVVQGPRQGPGIGTLAGTPAAALSEALAPWQAPGFARITLCGMVGARGGLREVAYVDCPVGRDGWRAGTAALEFAGHKLRIAAGVACRDSSGVPDVMRGEETQVFGAIALNPGLSEGRHRIILPGTHSKWIWLEDGRITGFRTFLTGELFALLQQSSLIAAGSDRAEGDDADGFGDPFGDGFGDGLARARAQTGWLGSLFETRTRQLRDGRSAGWARGFLSGLAIGGEVVEMVASAPVKAVTIIGDPRLAARYEAVLAGYGTVVSRADGDACALAGLGLLDDD